MNRYYTECVEVEFTVLSMLNESMFNESDVKFNECQLWLSAQSSQNHCNNNSCDIGVKSVNASSKTEKVHDDKKSENSEKEKSTVLVLDVFFLL